MSTLTERPQLTADAGTAALLRRGLLGLAALTIVGIALDLVTERHWTKPSQLIAWAALVALAVAVGLLARAERRWQVRLAQLLALAVIASAALGVWEHVQGNHNVGPLDARFAQSWDGLPATTQWWLAARRGVGPSPPLAPGALAVAGLAILLAAARHPVTHDLPEARRGTSP